MYGTSLGHRHNSLDDCSLGVVKTSDISKHSRCEDLALGNERGKLGLTRMVTYMLALAKRTLFCLYCHLPVYSWAQLLVQHGIVPKKRSFLIGSKSGKNSAIRIATWSKYYNPFPSFLAVAFLHGIGLKDAIYILNFGAHFCREWLAGIN